MFGTYLIDWINFMKKFLKIIKKIMVVLLILALAAGIFAAGINIYVRGKVKDRIITLEEAVKMQDVDCIVVLGASVVDGDTPSLMLQDRLDKSIEIYYADISPKLLMSGDHGGLYYDEVNVMKNYAMDEGVPSEDIFMDHAGFSTYESMYRAKEIFQAKKVIVVTQEYHLYRALYIADAMGLEAYGIPAEEISYRGQTLRDIREVLAITKDFVKCIFKPEPTMMGNPIDLKGDGNVTNDKE